jgi:hypothetical protein
MKRIMTDQNGFFHLFDPSHKSVQIRLNPFHPFSNPAA